MAFPSYCERNPMNCIQKAVAPKLPPQGYAEADFKLVENWALLRQSVGGIVQQALVDAQRAGGFGVITFTKETGYSLGLDEIADLQMGITEWTWNLLGDRMEGNLFDNWTAKGKPRFSFAYNEVARRIGIPLLFDDRHAAEAVRPPRTRRRDGARRLYRTRFDDRHRGAAKVGVPHHRSEQLRGGEVLQVPRPVPRRRRRIPTALRPPHLVRQVHPRRRGSRP